MDENNKQLEEIILDIAGDSGLAFLKIGNDVYIREFMSIESYEFFKEHGGDEFIKSIKFIEEATIPIFGEDTFFYLTIRKAVPYDLQPMKSQGAMRTLLAERGRVFKSYKELNDYLTAANLFNDMISDACAIDRKTRQISKGKKILAYSCC